MRTKIFIAHCQEDTLAAIWLQRKLEHFIIPRSQRKLVDGGKKFGRIFRDGGEAPSSTDLGFAVRRALEECDALIVVCSARTNESRWIGEEIKIFESTRPDRNIFVLLVGREKNELPPQLPKVLTAEPLAADMRGRHQRDTRAVTRLVAGILGCTFEDLQRRRRAETFRRQMLFWAPVSAITILLALLQLETIRLTRAAEAKRKATAAITAPTCERVTALGTASQRLEQTTSEDLKNEAKKVRDALTFLYWACVDDATGGGEDFLEYEPLQGPQSWLTTDRNGYARPRTNAPAPRATDETAD